MNDETLTVKAFVDNQLVAVPAADMREAQRLYGAYITTAGCDAAYIYVGETIVESWAADYDGDSPALTDCPYCYAPVFEDQVRCDECGELL